MNEVAPLASRCLRLRRDFPLACLLRWSSTAAAINAAKAPWNANQVRNSFIGYFVDKQHAYVPSSPVIPADDPTVLFTTAGMNQFKPIFLGDQLPVNSRLNGLKRAVNTQKCMRAGGKHNDLDDVGRDLYHHTFFEMLGSWSFGDYYKLEACTWAWELLTQVYCLPVDQLYITYFAGDKSLGIKADEECRDIWLSLGLPSSRLLPFGAKENFWEMGFTGPCGLCTEIHFDRIGQRSVPNLVNANGADVVELWNLVFMQYDRRATSDGKELYALPQRHVDTGCGFERLTSVMQNVPSSYDSDIFRPILHAIHQMSRRPPYQGRVGAADIDSVDTAYRIIADHVRGVVVALSEGAKFAKKDAGNVLRRMMRRSFFYGYEYLGIEKGTMPELVPVIRDILMAVFPEIDRELFVIKAEIAEEEELFAKALQKGNKLLKRRLNQLPAGTTVFPGETAWELHANYGYPLELTEIVVHGKGMRVERAAFDAARKKGRDLSAAASSHKFVMSAQTRAGAREDT